MMKNLSLYVHIPFCEKKCAYCDFLSFQADETLQRTYLLAVIKEMKLYLPYVKDYEIQTIFFGGGTPSILQEGEISFLMENIQKNFNLSPHCETSIEINPGTFSLNKSKEYRKANINRLSFGLQSTKENELITLGRIHQYKDFLYSYDWAREEDFCNINVDLIYGIPEQNFKSFQETLNQIFNLKPAPEHLSIYHLILEEDTPFYQLYKSNQYPLPDEKEEEKIEKWMKNRLKEGGYLRYEISNYAKKEYECYHNLVYWNLDEYIGIGLGAASYFKGRRYHNTKKLKEYLALNTIAWCKAQDLSQKEEIEEFIFLGLRKIEGISAQKFFQKFAFPIEDLYADLLEKLKKQGLLKQIKERIFLSEKGLDLSNYVMSQFLLD
ncbi:coproporphyrinogen III oxidase [Clostridia bacterium]|nr:coproporphyrinogen III oxidase [Clostridia bacterium]